MDTIYWKKKKNLLDFSGTVGVFSSSIQVSEWTHIKIKHCWPFLQVAEAWQWVWPWYTLHSTVRILPYLFDFDNGSKKVTNYRKPNSFKKGIFPKQKHMGVSKIVSDPLPLSRCLAVHLPHPLWHLQYSFIINRLNSNKTHTNNI